MPRDITFDEFAYGLSKIGGPLLPVLLIALALVAAAVTITLLRSRKRRREAAARAEAALRAALKKRGLSAAQEAAVGTLARHAPDPLRRHEILSSPRTFQAAVDGALRAGELPEDEISALRVTLGFSAQDTHHTVYSTAELPPELPLLVEQEKVRRFRARTESVQPEGITIVTEDNEVPPAVGSNLQIYFKREAGIFTFASRVLSLEGPRAQISHSEKIAKYQNRKYYRRKLTMPVQVRVAGSDEKPAQHRFLDLGGGGASISNPDLRFRPGDDVEIAFSPGSAEAIELVGEVIRLSEAGKVMHIAFGPIREAMRDRIIGFILNVDKKA